MIQQYYVIDTIQTTTITCPTQIVPVWYYKLSCSRRVTSLVKILHSGPTRRLVQFDHAGYTVRRSAQQTKLDAGKSAPKTSLRHYNSCVVSCLTNLTTVINFAQVYLSPAQPLLEFQSILQDLQCNSPAMLVHE